MNAGQQSRGRFYACPMSAAKTDDSPKINIEVIEAILATFVALGVPLQIF
jgi:hypothetical protein